MRYGQPVLVCSVEEGSGQLGFVALGLVKAVVGCSVALALVNLGFGCIVCIFVLLQVFLSMSSAVSSAVFSSVFLAILHLCVTQGGEARCFLLCLINSFLSL